MASCGSCNKWIIFGGKRSGDRRYCDANCQASGELSRLASGVSESEAKLLAARIHSGSCPECRGPGPNDVRTSYQVWSLVFMTRWKSTPRVSCRSCGLKAQAMDGAISLFAGWWGFPWGLLITPVQVFRNVHAALAQQTPSRPSAKLEQHARILLATQVEQS